MKKLTLDEYKGILFEDIQKLETITASSKEIKFALKDSWFNRVRKIISDFDEQLSFKDGAYDLFRILRNEFPLEILEDRLSLIAPIAGKQGRLRAYRKTRNELSSVQPNQIFGSLFEINILSRLINSCPSVEIFPPTGFGGGDVDAKLIIDTRAIYMEAKAFGYSTYDPAAPFNGYVGVHSIDSMIRQIYDGLNSKLIKGQQLYELSNKGPTVLALSLGFNADSISCSWAIEAYYEELRSNVSLILVSGSALCRGMINAFPNSYSSFPLSETEQYYFENTFLPELTFR